MTTCRAIASGTPRPSCAGAPTSRRMNAATTSSRSRSPTSWRRFSGPGRRSRERLLPFRRLHTRRLIERLVIVRRPGSITLAIALVARSQFEQRLERTGRAIDGLVRVPALLETRRYRPEGEVARIAGLEFVPLQRHRHGRIGRRSYRIGAGNRAVACVLVVVDENTVALLLPPLRGRELRYPLLHLACERERAATHLVVSPARLDANVDVHPALARCLWIPGQLEIL